MAHCSIWSIARYRTPIPFSIWPASSNFVIAFCRGNSVTYVGTRSTCGVLCRGRSQRLPAHITEIFPSRSDQTIRSGTRLTAATGESSTIGPGSVRRANRASICCKPTTGKWETVSSIEGNRCSHQGSWPSLGSTTACFSCLDVARAAFYLAEVRHQTFKVSDNRATLAAIILR
jgi:hypothetical protein